MALRKLLSHDTQARDSIFSGDYIRCKSELEVADPRAKSSWDKSKKVDVIVTWTADQRKCNQFKNAFLRNFAYLAASGRQPLDPDHPYSDTPVFDCSEKGIEATGDLTDMPQQTKEKILSEDPSNKKSARGKANLCLFALGWFLLICRS